MTPSYDSGHLVRWDDAKGYGFIAPDAGGSDVFVHSSACRDAGRRPRAGDRVLYRLLEDATGKRRAASVTIDNVPSRGEQILPSPRHRRIGGQWGCVLAMLLGIVVFGSGLVGVWELSGNHVPPPLTALVQPGCTIKGNISVTSGGTSLPSAWDGAIRRNDHPSHVW